MRIVPPLFLFLFLDFRIFASAKADGNFSSDLVNVFRGFEDMGLWGIGFAKSGFGSRSDLAKLDSVWVAVRLLFLRQKLLFLNSTELLELPKLGFCWSWRFFLAYRLTWESKLFVFFLFDWYTV